MKSVRPVFLVVLVLAFAGCAATATAPDAASGGYRQIWSFANSNLCVTIDGTNTPMVNTCTTSDPGWSGSDEYYNSGSLQNPQSMDLTINQPQLINMASANSSNPGTGTWYVIISTTAPNDLSYTTIVSVPQGDGILITRVANSPGHPGSSSIFCLPQSQIQSGSVTPGQRYPLCSMATTTTLVPRK